MDGLLSQVQQAPQPQTTKLSPEDQQKLGLVDKLSKRAMEMLYSNPDQFTKLIDMFKKGGPEGFAKAMSTAVNGVIDKIEQQEGELPDDVLGGIGITLISALSEDVSSGGIMQLDEKMIQEAAILSMQDWMTNHAERVDMDGAKQAAQQLGAQQ